MVKYSICYRFGFFISLKTIFFKQIMKETSRAGITSLVFTRIRLIIGIDLWTYSMRSAERTNQNHIYPLLVSVSLLEQYVRKGHWVTTQTSTWPFSFYFIFQSETKRDWKEWWSEVTTLEILGRLICGESSLQLTNGKFRVVCAQEICCEIERPHNSSPYQ